MTKSALHRTRLRFSDQRNFSVLFFYKWVRQPAPLLGFWWKPQTEKIERNFSVFQFLGSKKDRKKNLTNRKIGVYLNFVEWVDLIAEFTPCIEEWLKTYTVEYVR
ncbi:hypothetical protein BIY29_14925 [Brenneria alni]|uniref:Uncharacterized protein n=1 Tax=Brenneria alni TaxID=71656 RepID=A0A421DKX5_9GAMM|nr:hypothetical protein [Brenneria alni]RLM20558.1 hypothetical protein BIY29_14925 [Brenneria alni]